MDHWFRWRRVAVVALAAGLIVAPATAQFSGSYNFLKSVKDADGEKATKAIDQPGTTIINTRDDKGEGALDIVVKRRDATWLGFLLGKGAEPNIKDNDGNTPLIFATQLGWAEGVRILLIANANINLGNSRGETPLIFSIHNRDMVMARLLLANGANPRQADRIAGKSARDYAAEDPRAAAMLKVIDEVAPKPKANVQGPRLH